MPKRWTPPAPEPAEYRLAFNLFDLDHVHSTVRAKLLPLLDLRKESLAWVDRDDQQETAVPFTCDLKLAARACDVVRGMARAVRANVPRVYLSRRGGPWSRLPASAALTHEYRGQVVLDPALFPREAAGLTPVPLPPSKVQL